MSAQIRSNFPKTLQTFESQLKFVAETVADKQVGELEQLGTALLLTLEDRTRSVEERAKALSSIKPHVDPDAARLAVEAIDTLLPTTGTE